jgi:hypothetical protein
MRPVFEDRLVDALGPAQVLASISGDARVEDVVVTALDDVDGVDLHVAEVFHRGPRRLGPVAERRQGIESLGMKPDALRPGFRDRVGFAVGAGHGWSVAGLGGMTATRRRVTPPAGPPAGFPRRRPEW